MAFGEIEVFVTTPTDMDCLDIYFISKTGVDTFKCLTPRLTKEGYAWEWVDGEQGYKLPMPSVRVPRFMGGGMVVQKLVDAIYKEIGVHAKDAPVDQNEVRRLENHIDDLKKILFGFDYASFERGEPTIPEPTQPREEGT